MCVTLHTGWISCSWNRESAVDMLERKQKEKFPQSLQRCARRKADFRFRARFRALHLHSIALKLHGIHCSVKWMWRKLSTRVKFYFIWDRGNEQENRFWGAKCVNFKRRDTKFLARAKKNHCFVFIFFSFKFVKKFFRDFVYEKTQTRLKKWVLTWYRRTTFLGKNRKQVAVSVRHSSVIGE